MRIKSIRQKDKKYVFESFENDKHKELAVVYFKRFPLPDEMFPFGETKDLINPKEFIQASTSKKAQQDLLNKVMNNLINNIASQRVDYKRFLSECVERFENLEYEDNEIETVEQFANLPDEIVFVIATELYSYATTRDIFTSDEKKAKICH